MVTQPAVSLVQDRESSPARTGGLTTLLHHQLECTDVLTDVLTVYTELQTEREEDNRVSRELIAERGH